MPSLKELAFRVARSPPAGALVRFGFARADRLLPLSCVRRGTLAALYHHPRPSYGSFHELAVPLRAIPDVFALAHPRHADVRRELFELIAAVARPRPTWVLVNAGPRQDVPQVHFHLTDGDPLPGGDPAGRTCWPHWEAAIRGIASAPEVEARYRAGFTLVQPPGVPAVSLY